MDSKGVGRELKAVVFPTLRAAGFSEFASRTAWRFHDHCTDVIEFRSLGSYLGGRIGLTSHSVIAGAGVYYRAVHQVPWTGEPMPSRPQEDACHARLSLRKSMRQLWCRRPDVWYVSRAGRDLAKVVRNLTEAVETQALPWLEELGDLRHALDVFESRPDTEMSRGIMWQLYGGSLNSFARAEVVSALALALGDAVRAKEAYAHMLVNPYYTRLADLRKIAEERIGMIEAGSGMKRDA